MPPVTPDQPGQPARPDPSAPTPRPRTVDPAPEPASPTRFRAAAPRARREPADEARPPRRPPATRPAPATRPEPERRPGRAPLPLAAAVATGWAALLSYLPVAVVLGLAQLTEGDGGLVGAARTGLAGWLLGHGVPLHTGAGPLQLPPLALAVLAGWRVARAGVHTSRAIGARHRGSPRQVITVAGAVGIGYGLIGVLAALTVSAAGPDVSPVRAGLTLTGFGTAAALLGTLPVTGVLGLLARRTPPVLRDGLRTGLVAALLLLGAGAGAAGLAVATGGGGASAMIGAYRTGVTGQAGITAVSVGYAPNVAVWAAAYLLGPGFAVGTDTTVRTTEVSVGALPAVPLLAGLPDGPVGVFGAVLLAVPVLTGMAAGCLLTRRALRLAGRSGPPVSRAAGPAGELPSWRPLLAAALLAGPVAGAVIGLAAVASGGSLGAGRLAEIGPVSWQVSAVATVVVAVGAMIGAAATRALARH